MARAQSTERRAAFGPPFSCVAYRACVAVLRDPRQPIMPSPAKPIAIIAQVEGSGTGLPVINSMMTVPLPSPWPLPPAPTARTSPPTKQAGPPSGPHPSGLLFTYDVPPWDSEVSTTWPSLPITSNPPSPPLNPPPPPPPRLTSSPWPPPPPPPNPPGVLRLGGLRASSRSQAQGRRVGLGLRASSPGRQAHAAAAASWV